MKVSINWLKQLADINVSMDEYVDILNLKTIGTKEVTDRFIELDMKGYNRSDLLSMRGIAYETAAILNTKINFHEPTASEYIWTSENFEKLDTSIVNEDLCPVYCLVKIEGLKVEKSPEEWVQRLNDSGIRTVNNIADITNLIMLEYGQPLHAFDAAKVSGTVSVRVAKEGEELITLDQKKRSLTHEDLVIADDNGAIGLAGVMGGKDSEISESTTTILLEAAIFDPKMLRKTANRLGLVSEASKRFYHGLTLKRLLQALNAAITMYQHLGGTVTSIALKEEESTEHAHKIPLSLQKVRRLVGVEINTEEIEQFLTRLNFDLLPQSNAEGSTGWIVTPPYYRLDIEIEEDVIEEIARMYGYDRITATPLPGSPPEPIPQQLFTTINDLKTAFAKRGFTEIQSYSFYSTAVMDALGFKGDFLNALVRIANPISSQTEYMRMTLWANLLEIAAKNLKQRSKISIFEIGKIFTPVPGEKPAEKYAVSALVVDESNSPIESLYSTLAPYLKNQFSNLKFEPSTPPGIAAALFHPKRFINLKRMGK